MSVISYNRLCYMLERITNFLLLIYFFRRIHRKEVFAFFFVILEVFKQFPIRSILKIEQYDILQSSQNLFGHKCYKVTKIIR